MNNNIPFICPKCGKELKLIGKSLVCENKHCYDLAKSGYVNLLLVNQKNSLFPGDNKEMISARNRVMAKNYYKRLAEKIIEIIPEKAKTILDAGCGIGYIPAKVKKELKDKEVIGFDISKFAVDSASKKYKNVPFAVASSNNIPLKDNSVDVIICAFAPVFIDEINRVLKKGGTFIRVVPNYDHLYNLKQYVYDVPRENEVDKEEIEFLSLINSYDVRDEFVGDSLDMLSLIKMTPYYYHTKEEDIKKLNNLDSFTAKQSFLVREYIK